jgi:hypothetical protein
MIAARSPGHGNNIIIFGAAATAACVSAEHEEYKTSVIFVYWYVVQNIKPVEAILSEKFEVTDGLSFGLGYPE